MTSQPRSDPLQATARLWDTETVSVTSRVCGFAMGLLGAASCLAWGPHSEITQAALDALGTNDALVVHLGVQARLLTNHCWIGDYHRVICEDHGELFYADDYLLFPGATPQWVHSGTWLKTTFRPYFRRAVQALRTENAANASRWVGSLLHFVEDAGAPPHALGLQGGLHTKMESWVETNSIRIAGYRPQLLGATEDEVLEGLLQRLKKLDELATASGNRLKLQVQLNNRRGVKPVVLECALESSRVAADLLHSLGRIMPPPAQPSSALTGTCSRAATSAPERFPAKVVLEGTKYSTLADRNGRYEFQHLPPGAYPVAAFRPGGGLARAACQLEAGQTNRCDFKLDAQPANWIRNGDFKLRWASPPAPDCWYQTREGWEGEFIPLQPGQRYRLRAHFKQGSAATLLVRWAEEYTRPLPIFRLKPTFDGERLTPADPALTFRASSNKGVIQVVLKNALDPSAALDDVELVSMRD